MNTFCILRCSHQFCRGFTVGDRHYELVGICYDALAICVKDESKPASFRDSSALCLDLVHVICFCMFFLVPLLKLPVGWLDPTFLFCLSLSLLRSLNTFFRVAWIFLECRPHVSFPLKRWMKIWDPATIQMVQRGKFRVVISS